MALVRHERRMGSASRVVRAEWQFMGAESMEGFSLHVVEAGEHVHPAHVADLPWVLVRSPAWSPTRSSASDR